jgi:colanic acid biosynthesis glycosyl transferase WcaI
VLRQAPWRPDIIWVVEPALFTAPTAVLFSKLTGAKCWLHVQDFEVDAAFEMGLIRGRALRRTVSAAERFLLRQFSCVSTISYKMLALAERKGVDRRRLALFRNWVDVGHIVPRDGVNRFRTSLRIAADQVVALYSGNMGAKQGLEVLADAARDLQEDKRIMFVFCGDGVGRADLASRCSGLPNVIMIPLQPKEDLPELLSMADIHLLPQRADAADLVLPSKLTGMLASGRPVVATAQSDTELGSLIETAQCGLLAPPGDSRALVSAIQMLAADATRRTAMGRAGRNYAENHLSMDSVLREFEHKLEVLRQAGEALSPAMPTGDAMNERGRH